MAVKMRHNKDANSVCCECGDSRKEVLEMVDVCIGGNVFTICDKCSYDLFNKCLRVECDKNHRVKSPHDMAIIRRRGNK